MFKFENPDFHKIALTESIAKHQTTCQILPSTDLLQAQENPQGAGEKETPEAHER